VTRDPLSSDSIALDGLSLTPALVTAVAREGKMVRLEEEARARNTAAAAALARLVEEGTPIYGVTTGVGALRSREVPAGERPDHQLRLLRSHAWPQWWSGQTNSAQAAQVCRTSCS